jgi:hypothetical protein
MRHDRKLPADLRNLWLTWIVTACFLSVVMLLAGCTTAEHSSKTSTHSLFCVLVCFRLDVEHESDTKEKGAAPEDSAPTSLDGMTTPGQRLPRPAPAPTAAKP